MDESEMLKAALEKWGLDSQLDQTIEECAELIIAIRHFRRGRVQWHVVAEELADVSLCVSELALQDKCFDWWRARKLARLERLIAAPHKGVKK